MPADPSIYFQQQNADIVGSYAKGLQLGNMLDERERMAKSRAAMGELFKATPQAGMTPDQQRTLGQLASVDPEKAMAVKSQMIADTTAQQKAKQQALLDRFELTGRLLGPVKNQEDYDNALRIASENGIDMSQVPKKYSPSYVDNVLKQSMSAKDQILMDIRRADSMYQDLLKRANLNKAYREGDLQQQRFDLQKQRFEWQKKRDTLKAKAGSQAAANKFSIPGLVHNPDYPLSKTEVRDVRAATTQTAPLIENIQKAKQLIENSTRKDWTDPGFRNQVNGYLRDAQLTYKSKAYADLGVLAGPDLDILEEVLVNPFTLTGAYMGPEQVAKSYDQALERIKTRTKAFVKQYGYTPSESFLNPGGNRFKTNKSGGGKKTGSKPGWAE